MPFGWKYMIMPSIMGKPNIRRKRVFVFNDNFELIEKYDTVTDAAAHYGIAMVDISTSIKKFKKLKGVYFSYDNPFKEPTINLDWLESNMFIKP